MASYDGSEIYSPNQVYDEAGNAVCSVFGIHLHRTLSEVKDDPRCVEGLARARLIAASPALLEALKDACEVIEDQDIGNPVLTKARAAIALAEGEA